MKDVTNIDFNRKTVAREVKKLGFKKVKPIFKPKLEHSHMTERLKICKNWFFEGSEFWKQVIFSDESMFSSNNHSFNGSYYKKSNESHLIVPTKKFGGHRIMVWGCFSYQGVGKLVFIDGKINSEDYICILTENLEQSASLLGIKNFIFQQDNAPCHNSKLTREFFARKT